MNDESINVREDENSIKKDFNKSTYINTINISSSNTNNKNIMNLNYLPKANQKIF